MSFITKLVLLCAATSLLSQSAAGQAVVYPYNCDTAGPVCQTDCISASRNICAGLVGSLTETRVKTVGSCTAKYIPYQGVADTKTTCLANFQKILDGSNAAAKVCDGKTPGRVGGVIAMDANDKFAKQTSYAIFPVDNNPNCVVHPSKTKELVPARHSLFGRTYQCSNPKDAALMRATSRITSRSKTTCGLSIAGAAVCSANCAGAIFAAVASFGLAGAFTVASCIICATGETVLIERTCFGLHTRRSLTLGGGLSERADAPAMCSGSKLSSLSLEILPVCLQEPFQSSCVSTA